MRSELAIKLPRWLSETHHHVYFESSNEKPVEHNRNLIVKRFLESDKDVLLQIDSDVVPPRSPLELADLNLDIVSAPCWVFHTKPFLNVYRFDEKKEFLCPLDPAQHKSVVEIDATGSGILLTSRKVLEVIERPFERRYDSSGIEEMGQDLYFCEKARNAGFKIYTHFSYISKHYKTLDISSISS